MTRALALAALAVGLLASIPACGPRENCISRGERYTHVGTAATLGQATGATELALDGSRGERIDVDDFSPSCNYDAMQFTVRVEGCTVWFSLAKASYQTGKGSDGSFISANARTLGGQTCTVAAGSHAVTFAIDDGSFDVGATSTLDVVLAGATRAIDGAPAVGHLQWTFHGTLESVSP